MSTRVKEVLGKPVISADTGEKLGTVADLLLDDASHQHCDLRLPSHAELTDSQHVAIPVHANAGAREPSAVLRLHSCHSAHAVQELTIGALALSLAATTVGAGGIGRTPLTLGVSLPRWRGERCWSLPRS